MKFVNVEQVLKDSGLLAQEAGHLDVVRAKLVEGADRAAASYSEMTLENQQKARAADSRLLNIQWQAEQQAARIAVISELKKAVAAWREKHHAAAVLPAGLALSVSAQADISGEIAKVLKEQSVQFGTLPEVTLKTEEPDAEVEGTSHAH
ncbi:hypothetical protein NG99_00710 [Erwinia typographi]|uniref:Uncharacterized protein n=1 Tax=Erwinia typographi TaxID=371042 RepID=A0A0A4ADL1_9GAMM|nr:hypothetical protein [Erwinia typographi]KGT95923.1 hypothetical protein NG99_00710 [Erwinia typographi]